MARFLPKRFTSPSGGNPGYTWGRALRKSPCLVSKVFCSHRTKRSEEHTSELQSRFDLVCRLLLEKKKYKTVGPERMRFSRGNPVPVPRLDVLVVQRHVRAARAPDRARASESALFATSGSEYGNAG